MNALLIKNECITCKKKLMHYLLHKLFFFFESLIRLQLVQAARNTSHSNFRDIKMTSGVEEDNHIFHIGDKHIEY